MVAVSQEPPGASRAAALQATRPSVVLDTHIVLDWLWFTDPRVAALALAVQASRLQWLATADMRDELERVLVRFEAKNSSISKKEQVLTLMDQYVSWIHQPVPRWRFTCTDPDDQKFIDLAVHAQARWLVSRDRAVLKLRTRALAQGCEFTTPEGVNWDSAGPL